MKDKKANRREFLVHTSLLAGGGWLTLNTPLLLAAGHAAEKQRAAGETWMNLTPQEAKTITAVVDQIIPPDDLPGASDAGTVYFIDQALGGFLAGATGMLSEGLADLDRLALESFPDSGGFARLSYDQQTPLLQSIETGPFFNQMIFLTHCGMFAMPSWGGNRELSGWALLGFDNRHAWQPPFGFYDAQAVGAEKSHVDG
jgi:gluconate 2-dehydrogenase gamma chain